MIVFQSGQYIGTRNKPPRAVQVAGRLFSGRLAGIFLLPDFAHLLT